MKNDNEVYAIGVDSDRELRSIARSLADIRDLLREMIIVEKKALGYPDDEPILRHKLPEGWEPTHEFAHGELIGDDKGATNE
jgi:hypothetical protein